MSENEKKEDSFMEEDFNEDFGELKGDNSQKRNRLMILLLILLGAGGGFYFMTMEDESGFEDFSIKEEEIIKPRSRRTERDKKPSRSKTVERREARKSDETKKVETHAAAKEKAEEVSPVKEAPKKVSAFGALALGTPVNGATRYYDLSSDRPVFTWEGNAERIVFSRNQNMKPAHYISGTKGNAHTGKHLEPGTWYWQVRNSDGGSDVRSYVVLPYQDITPALIEPMDGTAIAQSGSVVRWSLLARAAYYRVQLTEKDTWLAPSYMFATSGSELTLDGLAPGSYKMRVGGFSEVSGRWEYSQAITVEVR